MNRLLLLIFVLTLLPRESSAVASRIKELANIQGVRPNQLVGYGLVVGLAGTGDDQRAQFSVQSVASMLKQLGVRIDTSRLILSNVAAVVVTAELPAYIAPGQRVDVTVSSIGTARSLQGGTLLMSPLKGADGRVYAVAQGALSVGGFQADGRSGSSVAKNFTTVGRVPGGALVERAVEVQLDRSELVVSLKTPDHTTAVRIADRITERLSELVPETPAVEVRNAGSVVVKLSESLPGISRLIAQIEALEVEADTETTVVINERTGTVVLGERVRIAPVAIAHGGLTVAINEEFDVSQPEAFSRRGRTAVTPRSDLAVEEQGGDLKEISEGASLSDVVRAMNALGVSPRDLVAILQALRSSGALQAELVVQ